MKKMVGYSGIFNMGTFYSEENRFSEIVKKNL